MNKSKNFNPEKYQMIFCSTCSGKGYHRETHREMNVCGMCGGFGLIKKEILRNQKKQKMVRMHTDCLPTL